MSTSSVPGADRSSAVLGLTVAVAFAFTVVGSNIPGPILPLYEDRLGMSPFVLAALFVTYFVALISMFLVMNRTTLGRHAQIVLPAALVVGIVGDVALWLGSDTPPLLFVGRALTGTCVGLATGSAAALAVAARGDSGRTLAASGAIGGSLIGLVAAAVVAEVFRNPTVLIYQIHAVALVVCEILILVALWCNRSRIRGMAGVSAPAVESGTVPARRSSSRSARLAAYGLGAAGWTVGGIAVGVLPTALRAGLDSDLLVMGVLGGIVLLVVAWGVPHLGRAVGRTPSAPQSLILLGAGSLLLAAGILTVQILLVLAGCLLWGIGQGFAYAKGLTLLTTGLMPVEQGRATSLYACTSYGFAALAILLAGALSSRVGYTWGASIAVLLYGVFCGVVLLFGRKHWAVGDTSPVPLVLAADR